MAKASQQQFRFLAVLIAALGTPAHGMEIYAIMEPQATPLSCAGLEYTTPPMGQTFTTKCRACDAEIKSAMTKAKGELAAAKAADGSVNAGTTAGTGLFASTVETAQKAFQSTTDGIASLGGTALNQKSGMAQKVSAAMKECSAQIKANCTGFGANDMAMANQAAQSCDQAGAQADATSGDKLAKAAEALKAATQAAQQAMGMMGQQGGGTGGGGEGTGLGSSGLSAGSNGSGLGETASSSNLDTTSNTGSSSLETQSPSATALSEPPANASELSSSRSPASSFSAGSGNSGSASAGKFQAGDASGGGGAETTASSGNFGSSGASSSGAGGGSSSTDGASAEDLAAAAAAAQAAKGAGEGEGDHFSGGGSPLRSTLGLESSSDELNALVSEGEGLLAGAAAEDAAMASQNQGANFEGRFEQSLFSRVKKKITQVSAAKGM